MRGGHWGKTLQGFHLYQYHHQHVTQPLLLEQVRDLGIDISGGQLSQLLTQGLDTFHAEKDGLLRVGLSFSGYIHTDDTGARHNGKTGYCTHIGNERFAWFESTESKSRINFLELLGKAVEERYSLDVGALEYMAKQKLPKALLAQLEASPLRCWDKAADFEAWLDSQQVKGNRHRRIMTEGALMGGLLQQGIPTDMAVISDDAGQFNVFDHALCWIHAERLVSRLIPVNDQQKQAVNGVRDAIWTVHADLKAYKQHPDPAQAETIRACFDAMCNTKTDYATLNPILKRLRQNRHELPQVLDRPELPLHNNLSERDIRDYVKKRKISGSTRSDNGRQCRDTLASLKKTCRKHGISFWKYLLDRLSAAGQVQPMADIIRAAACG
ncbi:MAG: transposase [Gammaproteobacteria bacterium]|nr:transposase [Gammaproteobacteria bacterium]